MFGWGKKRKKESEYISVAANPDIDWKTKETWEDYPAPDYDAMHTYCEVAFDNSGRTFYYRTRNPEIKVGNAVYVPVGYKYELKEAVVVSMKEYIGRKALFPLCKTKHIKGKIMEGDTK